MIRQLQHHEKYGVEHTKKFVSLLLSNARKQYFSLVCRRSIRNVMCIICGRIYVLIFPPQFRSLGRSAAVSRNRGLAHVRAILMADGLVFFICYQLIRSPVRRPAVA